MSATLRESPAAGTGAATPSPTREVSPGPVVIAAGGADVAAVLRAGTLVADRLQRRAIVLSVHEPALHFAWEAGDPGRAGLDRRGHGDRPLGSAHIAAGDTLPDVARELGAAAIVMGLGRQRPIDRVFGGETVLHTVRHAGCAVFAVPRGMTRLPREVIIGVDFRDPRYTAVRAVLPFVDPGAALHLLHVRSRQARADETKAGEPAPSAHDLLVRLRAVVDGLALPPGLTIGCSVAEGRPAERLLLEARLRQADLIVIGRQGRRMVERLVVGSVATRVLRRAACAVLVVPPSVAEPRQPGIEAPGVAALRIAQPDWHEQLDAFCRRNAGRLTLLERTDLTGCVASAELGSALFGTSYDERAHQLEIVLGESNGRRRHLTTVIEDALSVTTYRGERERDVGLRIDAASGSTTLTFVTPTTATPEQRDSE